MTIKGLIFNPAQYNFIPNPSPEIEFYPLIQTKIEFHPFIRKEHYPLKAYNLCVIGAIPSQPYGNV